MYKAYDVLVVWGFLGNFFKSCGWVALVVFRVLKGGFVF